MYSYCPGWPVHLSVHEIHGEGSPPEDPEDPQNGADPDPLSSGSPSADDLYRIGAVASITGISAERLRAWERRYGVTPAYRAGKTRFYSKVQLERLSKLKQLSDNGQPISSIVELSDAELDARLAAQRRMPRRGGRRKPRTGLIGGARLQGQYGPCAPHRFEPVRPSHGMTGVRVHPANSPIFQRRISDSGHIGTVSLGLRRGLCWQR